MVTWKGSVVYIVKSNYDVLLVQAPRSLRVENLTELDKLYLLLAEHNLRDSFNVLCYDLKIRSIADLNGLDDEALKRFRLLPKFAKDQLKQLPQQVGKADFVNLALVGLGFFCF